MSINTLVILSTYPAATANMMAAQQAHSIQPLFVFGVCVGRVMLPALNALTSVK
jgi:hypothetical protein